MPALWQHHLLSQELSAPVLYCGCKSAML